MGKKKTIYEIYNKILSEFGYNKFTLKDAVEKLGRDENSLTSLFSRMEKQGLLKKEYNDKEKRVYYYLVPMQELIKQEKIDKGKLIDLLKRAADLIRGKLEYEVLLLLLFYKIASDLRTKEKVKLKERYKDVSEEELEDIVGYPIKIPVDCYWHQAVSKQNLTKSIVDALRKIAEVNTQIKDAINFFLEAYLNRLVGEPSIDIALRDVVNIFNSVDFGELETDILGDAYEWLISYFAPQKAKAGELFTPREIVELLVRLLDPNKERNKILDPAAGSGGMLIYAYKYVKNNYGEDVAKELKLVGQELKDINYAILVLNFVLHGIPLDNPNVKLYRGDSLLNPLFRNEKFDIVIFNPPWNQDGYGEENLAKSTVKEYFIKYGYPPNNSADWAWIVLAINSVNENGKVGIVIDQGCLFRGGKEKELRKKIIEEDLIECVISTPPKLFYNTGAPAAIIIFNKNKPTERKNKILFIDASNYYEDHPEVRRLDRLSKEGIDKIVNAYKNFVEEKGFSKIVDITEIIKNDYNLNVSLYITPVFDEEFSIEDLSKEISEYFKLREELREIEEKLINHVKEIVRL